MTDDAEYWHRQAKEIRTIAERMKDPDERAMMFAMAADYDDDLPRRTSRRRLGAQILRQ